MPTSFLNLVNDPGDNTTGTLMDKAELQALLMGTFVTRTDTGAVNNWAPGIDGHTFTAWNGAADATFSGQTLGQAGLLHVVRNITAAKVAYFLHQSGSSSAGNKYTNSATSGATPVGPGGYIAHRHDGTDWQLVAHQQGAWITPTFAAGNYTGSGAMTWVPDSGDITTCKYLLDGRRLHVAFRGSTMSIGGTVNTTLQLGNGAYGGFTSAVSLLLPRVIVNDNAAGVLASCYAVVTVNGTNIAISKYTFANFTLSTNLTDLYFDLDFEVQ